MEAVKRAAKETGDFDQLSETDKKILALANDLAKAKTEGGRQGADRVDCMIVSDDMGVQNVAEKMGIKHMPVFNRRISKMIMWGSYCENCKKYYEGYEGGKARVCRVCGSMLKRVPVSSKDLE